MRFRFNIRDLHNRRWFQFRLKALFVLIAIAAIGCVVVPPVWQRMFPPEFDTDLSLIYGGGQEVHEDGPLPNRSPPFFPERE